MNAQQTETTVEVLIKMSQREINLWRLANTRATTDEEVRTAVRLLFQSLRERGARYLVRELGAGTYNAIL
jgi:hypothetical protein